MFDAWVLRHYFCSRTVRLILHFLYLRIVLAAERQRERGPVGLLHEQKCHFEHHKRPYLEPEEVLKVQLA